MTDARCPALVELFAEERAPGVDEHVAGCRRCQALLATQDERVEVETAAAADWRSADATAEAGAVALVASPAIDEYLPAVIAKVGDDAVTIVPVSEQVELASEWDLLLDRDILGYAAIAEVWNFGSVLPEQVGERLATLPAQLYESLRQLLRAAVTSGEVPEGLPVGPPVLASEDPRLLFHDEEAERVHVYWEPTLALAGAASLGQLVAHRREELAIPVEQLESLSLQRGWLDELERDALDIVRALQPKVLAAVFEQLRLEWSRRLRRIAEMTLEANRQSAGYRTGTSFARNRRGVAASSDEPSVGEYLDEVERHLTSHSRG